MIQVARLTLYPIKSLDGLEVTGATVLPSGALQNDRRYALQSPDGRLLSAKRSADLQRVRAEFADDAARVRLSAEGRQSDWINLPDEASRVAQWIGGVVGQPLKIVQDAQRGLPDDADAPGPTVISTASLQAIADRFSLTLKEARRRFRTNIEIGTPSPFWEDRLVGQELRLGGIGLAATNVCQRCAVPGRDSATGEATARFAKEFAAWREATLPAESPAAAFDHFYRAALNTRLVGVGGPVRLGAPVQAG